MLRMPYHPRWGAYATNPVVTLWSADGLPMDFRLEPILRAPSWPATSILSRLRGAGAAGRRHVDSSAHRAGLGLFWFDGLARAPIPVADGILASAAARRSPARPRRGHQRLILLITQTRSSAAGALRLLGDQHAHGDAQTVPSLVKLGVSRRPFLMPR